MITSGTLTTPQLIVNFNIKVPVRIHHKWSQNDLIVWVEGTVNRTVGN